MKARVSLIPALLALLGACGDDPTGSRPCTVSLTVSAGPVESLVDHGVLEIGSRTYRMELEGDSLIARELSLAPGSFAIEVRAVDANLSDLRAGTAFAEIPAGADTASVSVPLLPARSDLRLVSLSHEPASPVVGEPVTIVVDVANDGQGRSGSTNLAVRVGGESFGENFEVLGMEPGALVRFERVVVFTVAALYQVLAFVDPQDLVPEIANTNNAAIGVVRVGPASLPIGAGPRGSLR